MGIGAIIGTGIFVLTGMAASRYAGPAAVLSFVLAGAASALAAFVLVSIGVIVLRYTQPAVRRPFKVPLFPVVPVLAAAASIYLILNLPRLTWIRFAVWLLTGMILYLLYGSRHSRLARERGVPFVPTLVQALGRKELPPERHPSDDAQGR